MPSADALSRVRARALATLVLFLAKKTLARQYRVFEKTLPQMGGAKLTSELAT